MFRSLSRSTGKKATAEGNSDAPEKLGSIPSSANSSSGSLAVPSSSSGSLAVPSSSGSLAVPSVTELSGSGATMKRNVSISRATSKDVQMASASGNLTVKSLPPIPAQEELDQMFMEVVDRMNVQEADKARMMAFPAEKKWQLVLDSDHAKSTQNTNPPKHYLELLEHHLKKRKKKKNSQSAKEQAATEKDIQGMEISLRTNPLSWINEFIDPPNNGYDLLSEFLDIIPEEPEFDKERYLSLLCVKAVMNNKYGLNYVLKRAGSIQQLVNMLSLTQEKANILLYNILSAVCVVGGQEGHTLVLQALDNYAKNHEKIRYQTLVVRLGDERFNFDYKASLMAFITVLVHFPESIHHRIYLQYEFTMLGMDGLIDTLLSANSEVLDVQLHGYLSNFVSIPENYQSGSLPVAKKTHGAGASEGVPASDPIDLAEFRQEKADLQSQVISLQKELLEKEQAAANRISELQKQLGALQGGQPLDAAGGASVQSLGGVGNNNAAPEAPAADSSAPAATAGAPPPPPPPAPGAPPPPGPPPPPGMGGPAANNGLPPKRKIQPKVPLPTLNWMPIRDPSSTVFKDIDDENFHKSYDFTVFEQKFKKNVRETKDAPSSSATMEKKKPAKEEVQVVDANRSRNVLLAMKKIDMKNEDLSKAIQNLNTSLLSGDRAEILLRCIPTPEEVTSLQAYDAHPEKLSEGDRFLLFFSKIERAETKLKIMAFMESFEEDVNALQPQLNTVIAAAGSLRASVKLKKIFEVILAFGNYMNSAKRGGAYGFKLSALERLSDVKSNDSHSLLFFLADLISKDFPAYNAFTSDLLSLEAASMVSLQTTTSELNELVAGLKVLEGEMKYLKGNKQVEDFFAKATNKMTSLQADFANMTDMYQKTAAYFGEDPKTTETTEFFSHFLRFVKNYQAALKEIELLAKQAEKPKAPPGKRVRGSYVGVEKGAVDDVINEIRLKGFRR